MLRPAEHFHIHNQMTKSPIIIIAAASILLTVKTASAQAYFVPVVVRTEIIDYAAIEKAKADAARYKIVSSYEQQISRLKREIASLEAKIEHDATWKAPRPIDPGPQKFVRNSSPTASELFAEKISRRETGDSQAHNKAQIAYYQQQLARVKEAKAKFLASEKAKGS